MIKHVVCCKLADKKAQAQKTKEILLSMQGNVPMLRGIEVDIDELESPRSYDVMLTVLLDDMQALSDYQADEYHVSVVKQYMQAVTVSSVTMDYEIK